MMQNYRLVFNHSLLVSHQESKNEWYKIWTSLSYRQYTYVTKYFENMFCMSNQNGFLFLSSFHDFFSTLIILVWRVIVNRYVNSPLERVQIFDQPKNKTFKNCTCCSLGDDVWNCLHIKLSNKKIKIVTGNEYFIQNGNFL